MMECTSIRPCASSKGYDELQTLISVQKSAGEMPHFVVMHLSSKILHSKEVCPLPSLRTCSLQMCYCVWSVVIMCRRCFFFWLGAAWVKSRAERPSVSGVNRQLHVQIGCKLRIRNRKDELTKQAKRNKLQIKPEGN